jgi:hypothetical protein
MVTLQTGQPLATNPEYVVVTGGDYQASDLVEVERVGFPDQRVAFQAQFIATGENVP